MGSLKIALVHDFLFTYAGAERVLQSLHKLYPDAPIYTLIANPKVIKTHFPEATIHTSYLQKSWRRRYPRLLLPAYPRAVESFDFSDYDLVISSSGAFSHGIITGPRTLHICYCHTPMRYTWDWHAEHVTERKLGNSIMRLGWESLMHSLRLWDSITAKRVDVWLANSTAVADRIQTYYRQDAQVVYPPVDTTYFDPIHTPNPKKVMQAVSISRLSQNKRLDLLITACAKANLPLVIAGEGSEKASLQALSKTLKAKVTFLGSISEAQKRQLLAESRCFIFAAEDDFGIAPVEALAMGIPVLALKKGGATETVIDGKTGLFFTEPTADAIYQSLHLFLKNGVTWDQEHIRSSVLKFSEEHFQEHIQECVTHALS